MNTQLTTIRCMMSQVEETESVALVINMFQDGIALVPSTYIQRELIH